MNLSDYRVKIDEIDRQMVQLFIERMEISAKISAYKQQNNLPVFDPKREQEKKAELISQCPPKLAGYLDSLYSEIFEVSKAYQKELFPSQSTLKEKVLAAMETTPKKFPAHSLVACQGVEGAFSQQACQKIFSDPDIMYFDSFEGVFAAIDQGLCQYGVLPIENSTAGPVNQIYDLMVKYDFSIVRSTRVKVEHCLLANKGVPLSQIKEIFSHEQAIAQCAGFLKTLPGVTITPCKNTAAAAQYIASSGRRDAAALSSRLCAGLYSLDCLRESVQDQDSNYTKFICISKKMEIYPGADKTSLMMVLPHQPGSLYRVLAQFNALNINLIKIQSRPIPNSDFEFTFYFDLESSVYSPEFLQILCSMENSCLSMRYLGSYSEVL